MTHRVISLNDRDIINLSGDREVTNGDDFYLKMSYFRPVKGSIYDSDYFGSIYQGMCNCRRTQGEGNRCLICESPILNQAEALTRYGRIKLPYPYLNSIKCKGFISELKNAGIEVTFGIESNSNSYSDVNLVRYLTNSYIENDVLYCMEPYYQWTEEDLSTIKYFGLYGLKKYAKDTENRALIDVLDRYLSNYLLVFPYTLRKVVTYTDRLTGSKFVEEPLIALFYKSVFYLMKDIDKYLDTNSDLPENEYNILEQFSAAAFARYLAISQDITSKFLKPSKENIARSNLTKRISASARGNITGDPSLRIDEIRIPISLAFELMGKDFLAYAKEKLQINRSSLRNRYINADPQLVDLFKEFAEKQCVLVYRNPTLHKYNLMALKVKVHNGLTIQFPLQLCSPFNADFDGDTCGIYGVPSVMTETMLETMSPRVLFRYEKNNKQLFVPNHEILQGLSIATRKAETENVILFDSIETLFQEYEMNNVEVDQVVTLSNQGTDLDTTYGIEMIKSILGFDFTQMYVDHQFIDAKNIQDIVAALEDDPERPEKLKKLQEFALEVVTLYGVTAISPKDLYSTLPDDISKELYAILDDTSKSQKEKNELLPIVYDKLMRDRVADIKANNEKIRDLLDTSGRVKLQSIADLAFPIIYIDGKGDYKITKKSFLEGLDPFDYSEHAKKNREILALKAGAVPIGGYVQRQTVYATMNIIFDGTRLDEDNIGIELPMNLATGRTKLDGNKVPKSKSTELVRVRSYAVTDRPGIITPDLIGNSIALNYKHGADIGISTATSISEELVQSGLALKHGGSSQIIDSTAKFYAKKPCHIIQDTPSKKLIIEYSDGESTFIPILPFTQVFDSVPDKKANDIISISTVKYNNAYKLDAIKKFLGASGLLRVPKSKSNDFSSSFGIVISPQS